ncbi:alpha/beta fold hydrolase [Sphingosinicella sp. CPCC 101087]|uniref:alpha/beta fold hydrolase n=1 Tax=Sphingosinicella sp. CPCC 101087 TaxID=2497754 RepID=UPI0013EB0356|nr:alpha/beta hydrolase [Sphingosinicella sp. CPCC 101087]
MAALPDTRLWYQDTGGRGDAVILLHAWTGSYAFWAYQQAPLAAAGYRVISYSMRGHYRSDPIDPASPGTATGDLRALMDHLDISRAHLVGTAGGALPALDFGLSYPGRTISLVLSSSIMGISDPEFLEVGRRMFPRGVYAISHTFSELGPSYRAGNPEGVAAWEAVEAVAWQGGTLRQGTARPITFERMNGGSAPILLITGDADLMMPPSRLREVARNVPRCELAIVAEAGHALHWEQPEAFNAAILEFMGRHGDSSSQVSAP